MNSSEQTPSQPLSQATEPFDGGYRPDPKRVYYHAHGHFHGDYSVVDVNLKNKSVKVIWATGVDVTLRGEDAWRFLKLNRSRHASLFEQRPAAIN